MAPNFPKSSGQAPRFLNIVILSRNHQVGDFKPHVVSFFSHSKFQAPAANVVSVIFPIELFRERFQGPRSARIIVIVKYRENASRVM